MTAASNHLFPIDEVSEDVYVSSDTTGSTLDVSLSVDTDDLEQSLAEWMANSRNRQVEFEADIAASAEVSLNIFIEKLVWLWFK